MENFTTLQKTASRASINPIRTNYILIREVQLISIKPIKLKIQR
jgi:hypothetical protein